jgi:hypothetical protein
MDDIMDILQMDMSFTERGPIVSRNHEHSDLFMFNAVRQPLMALEARKRTDAFTYTCLILGKKGIHQYKLRLTSDLTQHQRHDLNISYFIRQRAPVFGESRLEVRVLLNNK